MNNKFIIFFSTLSILLLVLITYGKKDTRAEKKDELSCPDVSVNSKEMAMSDEEWKKLLSEEQYNVMRKKGTELPFSGKYTYNKGKGIYQCAACGNELFSSDTKFESGIGWPSFWKPAYDGSVKTIEDNSLGMRRIEVICGKCGSHLGHLFPDGPKPTGQRYCINSVALKFNKEEKMEKATFGGGCFWGVEAKFRKLKGVVNTTVGYMGGTFKNPTYEDICTDKTSHAEVVHIEYDPSKVTYEELLDVFWKVHNPTQFNRQGPDIGTQYRSVIFFYSPKQEALAKKSLKKLEDSKVYDRKIVTQIAPAAEFYKAEEYHQRYLEKHGLDSCKAF